MKTISILVPETAIPAAIVDPQYMFTAVNGFFQHAGHQPFFKVQLVGATKEIKLIGGSIIIKPDFLLTDTIHSDLIIIPAISGNVEEAIRQNEALVSWVIAQHKKGAEVASLCIGAFLLASTGLLNGKSCSTHWLFANDFRNLFPEVKLTNDRVVTDQDGLYSSGGAASYWNLLLYLVEKYTSREMAVMASKFFLLDIEKNSQLPFTIFQGQKTHGDEAIVAAQEYIEKHYAQKLTVDELANRLGVGRRTFERKFKKATSNTVIEYIQRVRIEAAKKQLEHGRKTVNEVMYETGYSDSKAFRELFKKIAGVSPVDYQNKFKN